MLPLTIVITGDDFCHDGPGALFIALTKSQMRTYTTVSEAIAGLEKRGYSIDFNLGFDGVTAGKPIYSLASDKFDITEVYRFEGETNPDDEAVVYAIESHDGIKGVIVNGYGVSTNSVSDEMIKQLSFKRGAS